MINSTDVFWGDPIIQALIAEAAADMDVMGLVLTGSRAVGEGVSESDYDVAFVVADHVLATYEENKLAPKRGSTIAPPIDTRDIWHTSPRRLTHDAVIPWMRPAWAESRILYDPSGEVAKLIDELRAMPVDIASEAVRSGYDAYLNALYRSLKAWHRGNELGARLEAAQSADYLIRTLFALEGEWCPYSSRLHIHLHKLEGQGWGPSELSEIVLELISTGDPERQRVVALRVVAIMQERGVGDVYDSWDGAIEHFLMSDGQSKRHEAT